MDCAWLPAGFLPDRGVLPAGIIRIIFLFIGFPGFPLWPDLLYHAIAIVAETYILF